MQGRAAEPWPLLSPVKGHTSTAEDNDVLIAMYMRHLQVAQAKQSHAEETAAKLQAAVGHVTVSWRFVQT
jgi:hypothetical protein